MKQTSKETNALLVVRQALEADALLRSVWDEHPDQTRVRPSRPPVANLANATAIVAMMARRSYGKSTLLNALIRRHLLFTHRHEATSFPIYMTGADADLGEIRFADGRKEKMTEVSATTVKAATAKFTFGRRKNINTIGAEQLCLALQDWPLPQGLTLIDLAGFDDSVVLDGESPQLQGDDDARAARRLRERALDDADAVIFVLRPKVFLGELEKNALAEIFREKGPRGVIPVFNIEVYEEPDEHPDALVQRFRAAVQEACVQDAETRYARFLKELGIDGEQAIAPVMVAALPALLRPEVHAFGLDELQRLLHTLSRGERGLASDVRPFGAGRVIEAARAYVEALYRARTRFEAETRHRERQKNQTEGAKKAWKSFLSEEASSAATALGNVYFGFAETAFKSWAETPGSFWETVDRLNRQLDHAASAAVALVVKEQTAEYRRQFDDRGSGVDPQLHQALQRVYQPRTHTVLAHAPDVGFLDELLGNGKAMRLAKWKEFVDDVEWEVNRSRSHWEEQIDAIRDALEAHLPAPPREPPVEVVPCSIATSADILEEAIHMLRGTQAWNNEAFQHGLKGIGAT